MSVSGDTDVAEVSDMLLRLRGRASPERGGIVISTSQGSLKLALRGADSRAIVELMNEMDGTLSVSELIGKYGELSPQSIRDLIVTLQAQGLMEDARNDHPLTGLQAILRIEALADELTRQSIHRNIFWEQCLSARSTAEFPLQVAFGLILENYHFLYRESYFDAPVLSYVANAKVRASLNAFYAEEYGHDELLMRALIAAGYDRYDIEQSIPLPTTMALCNALAYWSHFDPLFFFTTLGLLEGQGVDRDSFIECCERIGLQDEVLSPVQAHARINQSAGHGNLTRELFANIPVIDSPTLKRLDAQTRLFVELYDQFYTGVWTHYTSAKQLVRSLPAWS